MKTQKFTIARITEIICENTSMTKEQINNLTLEELTELFELVRAKMRVNNELDMKVITLQRKGC